MTAGKTERVTFNSDGLNLAGIFHPPANAAGKPAAAFIALHGFGGTKDRGAVDCEYLVQHGYAAFRFDFRGCGESEGEHGRIICLEQIADVRSAIDYLQSRTDLDPARIGLIGHSFGAADAIYAGGVDERVGAVISFGGWGDGERKFRAQHNTPEAWERFERMRQEGQQRHLRGERTVVPRYDIVPIPENLRGNVTPGSIQQFPWETVQSMYDFRPDDVVGRIAPRPLLLVHPAHDSVTPSRESIELFQRAGRPTELHLLEGVDHFVRVDEPRVSALLEGWLASYFPANVP
ncbi:MAG: alpha/beta hydrolase [Chloroflexota bacterium]|nr:alpha/beta hydrolase [Chloroflexota bacterium]